MQPEEAGAGLIVNGSAREPRAFQGRHSSSVTGFTAFGKTPYPGVWHWPSLDTVPLENFDAME